MFLGDGIDDGEVTALLVAQLPRLVPCGGPRVYLMGTHTHGVTIIIPQRGTAHGDITRAQHAVHHDVLAVELLEMLPPLLRQPVRLSGDCRRTIDRRQARTGGPWIIIDVRVLRIPVEFHTVGNGRGLFGGAGGRWCG